MGSHWDMTAFCPHSNSRQADRAALILTALLLAILGKSSHALAESLHTDHPSIQADPNLSLAEVVDHALEIAPARFSLTGLGSEAAAWTSRGSNWWAGSPRISVSYRSDQLNKDNGLKEYEAGLALPLWRWGERGATKNLGQQLSAETEASRRALFWDISGQVRELLWHLAAADAEVEFTEQRINLAERLLKAVARQHELGDVALGDLLLARSNRLEAESEKTRAEAMRQDSHRVYASVTHLNRRPPYNPERISEIHDVPPDHPWLYEANARISSAQAEHKRLKKAVRGSPSLLVGPKRERAPFDTQSYDSFGITLSLPIVGSAHGITELARAERVIANAQTERENRIRELTLQLHEAQHSLEVTEAQLETATSLAGIAEQQLNMSFSAYESGEMSLFDLLGCNVPVSPRSAALPF